MLILGAAAGDASDPAAVVLRARRTIARPPRLFNLAVSLYRPVCIFRIPGFRA
jgi:hypothetical protein